MDTVSTPQQQVRRIGLAAGPVFALLLYLVLPHEYRTAGGDSAPFTQAGRATLAVMG